MTIFQSLMLFLKQLFCEHDFVETVRFRHRIPKHFIPNSYIVKIFKTCKKCKKEIKRYEFLEG